MLFDKFTIIRHHTECSFPMKKMELSVAQIWDSLRMATTGLGRAPI
jgi:hypothetical protein